MAMRREEDYLKEAARNAKASDKERSLTENKLKVLAFNLQALLLSPVLKASSMYYKTNILQLTYAQRMALAISSMRLKEN